MSAAPRGRGPRVARPCRCVRARHVHGTRAAYVGDGCRCEACTEASRVYEAERLKARAMGIPADRVPAGPVRAHVQALRAQGMGYKRIAEIAGVAPRVLAAIIWHHADRPDAGPQQRVTRRTAARLLAVEATLDNLAPGRLVPAVGTTRRLQALVALGWSRAKLARRLGMTPTALGRALHGTECTARTAVGVVALYDELWKVLPSAATAHDRQAAARARNEARRYGWVPPLAWDDDALDAPDAVPAEPAVPTEDPTQRVEDLEFLLDQGVPPLEAVTRAGFPSRAAAHVALRRVRRPDLRDRIRITRHQEVAA